MYKFTRNHFSKKNSLYKLRFVKYICLFEQQHVFEQIKLNEPVVLLTQSVLVVNKHFNNFLNYVHPKNPLKIQLVWNWTDEFNFSATNAQMYMPVVSGHDQMTPLSARVRTNQRGVSVWRWAAVGTQGTSMVS